MRIFALLVMMVLLTACGFQFQGPLKLAPALKHLYLKTPDPYGNLARYLKYYFKLSNVEDAQTPEEATMVLEILKDETSQSLLSVSGTQQTQQYNLIVTVVFQLTDATGRVILGPQTLAESKVITVQSNQILGSSNEANTYYQQMRRTLAYAIMNRISSDQVTRIITAAYRPVLQHG